MSLAEFNPDDSSVNFHLYRYLFDVTASKPEDEFQGFPVKRSIR